MFYHIELILFPTTNFLVEFAYSVATDKLRNELYCFVYDCQLNNQKRSKTYFKTILDISISFN